MLNNLERIGRLHELESVIQWEDFRCYVAHLWNEKRIWMLSWRTQNNSPQYLWLWTPSCLYQTAKQSRQITGSDKELRPEASSKPRSAALADMTGFSLKGRKSLVRLRQLERELTPADWTPESLFGQIRAWLRFWSHAPRTSS